MSQFRKVTVPGARWRPFDFECARWTCVAFSHRS